MSAGEIAAIIVAVTSAVLVVGLLFALNALTRTMRSLRIAVEDLRRETVPLVSDMRGTVSRANEELTRVDTLLGTAESVGTTIDSGSRLLYLFFANPVIKALAFGSGTARAARRLRRGPGKHAAGRLVDD